MRGHGGWGQGRQDTGCPLMLILKEQTQAVCACVVLGAVHAAGVGLH